MLLFYHAMSQRLQHACAHLSLQRIDDARTLLLVRLGLFNSAKDTARRGNLDGGREQEQLPPSGGGMRHMPKPMTGRGRTSALSTFNFSSETASASSSSSLSLSVRSRAAFSSSSWLISLLRDEGFDRSVCVGIGGMVHGFLLVGVGWLRTPRFLLQLLLALAVTFLTRHDSLVRVGELVLIVAQLRTHYTHIFFELAALLTLIL